MYTSTLGTQLNTSWGGGKPVLIPCFSLGTLVALNAKLQKEKRDRYNMLVSTYQKHLSSKRRKK